MDYGKMSIIKRKTKPNDEPWVYRSGLDETCQDDIDEI